MPFMRSLLVPISSRLRPETPTQRWALPLILLCLCAVSLLFSACTPTTSDPITTVAAGLAAPSGVVVDSSGNLYLADAGNHVVRKIDTSGNSSVFAGNNSAGYSGDGGLATSAQLNNPSGVAVDSSDNLYIADTLNHVIRMVDSSGNISTIAGNNSAGYSGDTGLATSAQLNSPAGVAVDSSDNLYIADTLNHVIRMVDSSGNISTIAGNNSAGYSGDSGFATSAQLNSPFGIAVDSSNNLYIADTLNHVIRMVDSSGNISTTVGTGAAGYSGDGGGPATDVQLNSPYGIAIDGSGENLYIADAGNQRIRQFSILDNDLGTFAGTGAAGYSGDSGLATSAELNGPHGVTLDSAGDLYIADTANNAIRKVTALQGVLAVDDLAATTPNRAVTIDVIANDRDVDSGAIIDVTLVGSPISGTAVISCSCADLIVYTPTLNFLGTDHFTYTVEDSNSLTSTATVSVTMTNGPLINAWVDDVFGRGLAADQFGNVYFADFANNVIYKIAPNGTRAIFAGNNTSGYSGDGSPATSAQLASPYSVAVDGAGIVYIADSGNAVIRKVDTNGTISTFAGNNTSGYSGDGGPATSAELDGPYSVAVDGAGIVYIVDSGNDVIRKVDTNGTISTFAGNNSFGYSGDGGPATSAQLYQPVSVKVDNVGNVYIVDLGNNVVRKVDSSGQISTIAGNGTAGDFGNGGLATQAALRYPIDLAVDNVGNLYISDVGNNVIRKVDANGQISTVVGTGIPCDNNGDCGDSGPAIGAQLYASVGIALDRNSNLYISDLYNQRIRRVVLNHTPVAVADSATTAEDTPVTLGVLANDSDIDSGDSFSVTVAGAPVHGTVMISGATQLVYTPALNFVGVDNFTYTIADTAGLTASTSVAFTVTPVNDAPTANADAYSTAEDQALSVSAPGVLNNDSDVDGDTLTAVLLSNPSHGVLTLNANGSFTYMPTANYTGADSFTYKANDGVVDSTGTSVNLTVTPVNDAPTANADSYNTGEDQTLNVNAPGVLSNDTDLESDALTAVLLSNPSHGVLTLNADGSFTYAPTVSYTGTDSFTYKANDGVADSSTVAVNLTVVTKQATHTNLQLAPNPAQLGQSVSLTATITSLARTLPNLTGNVTFQDGSTILGIAPLSGNRATFTKNDWTAGTHPITAYYSGDSLYAGSVSTVVTQQITVLPFARNDAAGTLSGQAVTLAVLTNDLDPVAGGLIVDSVAQPTHGVTAITGSEQTVTYTPTPGFQGLDSFTYLLRDSNGQTDQALVAIVVGAPQVGTVLPATETQLAFSNSLLTLTLPAEAYPENLTAKDIFYLAYTQGNGAHNTTNIEARLGDLQFGNLIFSLTAYANDAQLDHFNFASPVTLTITYDPALLGALQPETLTLLYWDGATWSNDGITVLNHDLPNHQFTVTLAHLSEFGLFGQPPTVNPGQRTYLPWISR